MSDLPQGWAWTTLDEIAEVVGGVTKDSARQADPAFVEVPYLRVANVQRGYLDLRQVATIRVPPEKARNLELLPGDVLFNEGGDRDKLGRGWVWSGAIPNCIHQNHVFRARLHTAEINPRFLSWYGNEKGRAFFESQGKQTTNLASISLSNLKRLSVPLPPAREQQRIVDAIDEHFSHLDAAVESLERAQRNLRRMRKAVLGAAATGRLVPQDPGEEPADLLLKQIVEETNAPLEQVHRGPFSELPSGWTWATTRSLFTFVTSGSRGWAKYYTDDGDLFLRVGNLDHDSTRIDLRSVKFVRAPTTQEAIRTRTKEGDILVSITADVGMVGLVPKMLSGAFVNQHISLARPAPGVHASYIAWVLAGPIGQRQLRLMQRGATKVGLGLDDIRSVIVPLPPLQEQHRIVTEIERQLSILQECEAAIGLAEARAKALRRSVFHSAFRGALVAQEPTDEPASVLLERLATPSTPAPTPQSRAVRRNK